MSECVVRMEMPENCARCELFAICTGKCKNEVVCFDGQNIDKKDRRCLFVCALPENHGRLVDADALNNILEHRVREGFTIFTVRDIVEASLRQYSPTIVPAERSET